MKWKYLTILAILSGLLFSCSSSRKANTSKNTGIGQLKFLDEYIVSDTFKIGGTQLGGLSGIDYDAGRGVYYMVCDDPSAFGPTRFYTAKIYLGKEKIDSVRFVSVTPILNRKDSTYPDIRKDRIHSADLEAMRYDPTRDELIRSSEGQRVVNKDTMLQDPDVIIMDRNGRYKDSFALPANMHVRLTENGPRHNSVFEGLAFSDDHSQVFVAVEDAIYEDGPRAGTGDSTAWVRILKFDRNTKSQIAQYAYKLDPVPYPAKPAGAFKVNGISDILNIGNDQMLVIERAWSFGRVPSDVRLYLADLKGTTDISEINSLEKTAPALPIKKKLLFNLESLNLTVFNVEGATYGPKLENGHSSLILVVDDNFSKTEKTQFLLFEILP